MAPSEDARFRQALLELYESANLSAVGRRILEAVSLLVPGDVLALTEIDAATGRIGGCVTPDDYYCVGFRTLAESYEVLKEHFHEHPVVMEFGRTRSGRAERISDHLFAPAFHESALYQEFYRKLRVEDQLVFMVQTGPGSSAGVAISRARRSLRQVHVDRLNRLGPHIAQAYRNAHRITTLERYATVAPDRIASALDELGLSRRQADVLHAIAGGRSNREAASLLGISPLTIKKHLEAIYPRLGVGTRSAAVATLLGRLGFTLTGPRHRRGRG